MRDLELEHPAVSRAQLTGYGYGEERERPEEVDFRELAQEDIEDFIDWVLAGEPDALERFADDHRYLWREFGWR